ncbi:MAG: alpha-N-arabinofuranosidase [Armatimonadetes bacterium]|nr:alpha-N-arabinofuranosidase [Armatimonadota bacterium]
MRTTVQLQGSPDAPIVNKNIYGHFAEHLGKCIYEGIWVGEDSGIPNTRGIRNDVVSALKELNIPVLRWPGGCFADEYHWKDGIGPRKERPAMINTHWGGVVENNHFGTHEFFDLCEQLGTAPYVCGNVGSGTPQEMMEWVEYITAPHQSPMADLRRKNGRDEPWHLPFFGVGNESWGCGGNMRPEYYADEYRRFNTFVKSYGGKHVYRIACGANSRDLNWTKVLMDRARDHMNGLSLHNYTLLNKSWPPSGSSTDFDESEWISILEAASAMDGLIAEHSKIMDQVDPDRKVGLIVDEWGTWYPADPGTNPGFLRQQNSLRDALVAAIHFHIFHRHADRVVMANIAQTVNVLQAMILTDGPKMLRTPTYWVFHMFQHHQGGQVVPVQVETQTYAFENHQVPMVSASATVRDDQTHLDLSLANLDPQREASVEVTFDRDVVPVGGRLLTAPDMRAHNTFDNPEAVIPREFAEHQLAGRHLKLTLPSKSVVMLHFGTS